MRTIRPAPKAAKDQMVVAKPGTAPKKVSPRPMPLVPQGAADGRSYGKPAMSPQQPQQPQINPPPGLLGQGI